MPFFHRVARVTPGTQKKRRRWKDMGRAEKFALIQSQVMFWALVGGATYLFATRVSVVFALIYVVPLLGFFAWIIIRIRREGDDG